MLSIPDVSSAVAAELCKSTGVHQKSGKLYDHRRNVGLAHSCSISNSTSVSVQETETFSCTFLSLLPSPSPLSLLQQSVSCVQHSISFNKILPSASEPCTTWHLGKIFGYFTICIMSKNKSVSFFTTKIKRSSFLSTGFCSYLKKKCCEIQLC